MWLLLAAAVAAATPPRPARRVEATARTSATTWAPAFGAAALLGVVAVDRISVVVSLGIVAATVAGALARRRRSAHDSACAEAVAAFLGHLVTNVKAGATTPDAIARAAQRLPSSTPESVHRDIRRAAAAARSGAAPDTALGAAETPQLREVGALWAISAVRGLPVGELLSRARERIDHEQRHRAATQAALAGPKTTAIVLSALPAAGILMGTAMGANPLGVLVDGGVGGVLLIAGCALVCAGYLACARIIEGAAR
ncbi:type II secretion system F family protein [Corynebacterium timonense]|uniref:Type II secretion system protein F (GspF) n=1 Tax=Corynebacterium timonense TaxID=441500 RepID=A0A1H1TJ56_9CORY|nr:type II secretion system F family protein [Corynebacterium timonense]SDS60345.1 type II secretion system protein F (GspF) [Corynebacterium timonense]